MWAVLGRGVALVVFLTCSGACNANPAPTSAADSLAALLTSSHWVYQLSAGHWAVGDLAGGSHHFDEPLPASLSMTPGGVLVQTPDNGGVTFTQMNPANIAELKDFRLVTGDVVQSATLDASGRALWLHLVDDSGAELVDRGVARVDLASGVMTKVGGVAQRDGSPQSYFVWSQSGGTLILVRCRTMQAAELGHCPWQDVIDASTFAVRSFENAVLTLATTDEFAIASDERDPYVAGFVLFDLVSGELRSVAPAITGVASAHVVDDSRFVIEGATDAPQHQLVEIDAKTGRDTKLDEGPYEPEFGPLLGQWTPMSPRWIVLIAPPIAPLLDKTRGAEGRIYDLEQQAFAEQVAQIRLP